MYCKNCGNVIKENCNFCINCGTKVNDETDNNTSEIKSNNKFGIILLLIIVGILALIIGSHIIVSKSTETGNLNYYEKTGEFDKYKYKNQILKKWNVTLPLNNTNDLKCAAYYITQDKLYLEYKKGVCIVDENDNVNRYLEDESKYYLVKAYIDNARNGNTNYVYMSADEFENIIGK